MKNRLSVIALFCSFFWTLQAQKIDSILLQKQYGIYYDTGLMFGGSSQESIPFWMKANKSGLIPNSNHALWNFEIAKVNQRSKKVNWDFGIMGVAAVAEKTKIALRDYFIGLSYDQVRLSVGAKANEVAYDGLSSTNGDFIESLNARPYPQLRLEVGYTTIPFTKGWVQFKGLYSEGLMFDERFVDKPRVHYKDLYLKIGKRKLTFEVGLKHFVQWGGTSPTRGKLPTGLGVYYDLFFAKDDSKYDPQGSVIDYNRVGNHIGMYDVKLRYKTKRFVVSLYRQIIFEDSSGRNFMNKDALMGIHLKRLDKKSWLQAILFEYYYTKYQSGSLAGAKPGGGIHTGRDNYFNQSVYRSGWTSYGNTIGTPLFTPRYDKNGMALGIRNNRVIAFHGGVFGYLSSNSYYKAMMTYSHNYGTYSKGLDQKQLSGILEVVYSFPKIATNLSLGVASDLAGSYLPKNQGVFIKISTHGWWRK